MLKWTFYLDVLPKIKKLTSFEIKKMFKKFNLISNKAISEKYLYLC